MPRLTAPRVCRNERTFSSRSRVPYSAYSSASICPGMTARTTEWSSSELGAETQGSGGSKGDHDGLAERARRRMRCSRARSHTSWVTGRPSKSEAGTSVTVPTRLLSRKSLIRWTSVRAFSTAAHMSYTSKDSSMCCCSPSRHRRTNVRSRLKHVSVCALRELGLQRRPAGSP